MSQDQRTIYELLVIARDPSERKHQNNPQSVEAHKKALTTKEDVYKRTMELLKARGEYGATSKEIARAFGRQLNTVSGRFAEMKALGWIRDSGLRREGAAVLIVEGK